jgi:membrane protease YdiL (CAAX protease family)
MTSKSRLYVSIAVIILYWAFALNVATRDSMPPANDLRAIVSSILLVKFSVLAIVVLLLMFENEPLTNLGFNSSDLIKRILIGTGWGAGIWLIIHVMINPAIKSLMPVPSAQPVNMAAYFKEPEQLLIWIPLVIFAGGFVEEVQRIFILTRFEKLLRTSGLILSLIVGTIIFGMGHLYQGLNGAISAGISGLFFAFVYLRKRSAWEAVSAHALYDVIGVVIGFLVSQ